MACTPSLAVSDAVQWPSSGSLARMEADTVPREPCTSRWRKTPSRAPAAWRRRVGTGGARYQELRTIGAGATSDVVEARDLDRGHHVALKRLKLLQPKRRLEVFFREVRVLGCIDHPNVIDLIDCGHDEEGPYLVLELLQGIDFGTLRRRAWKDKQGHDKGVLLQLLLQAAQALDAAHNARTADGRCLRLVHRDVKPANLFATMSGCMKVLDFGIAQSTLTPAETSHGEVTGTVVYMAPEQLRGEPADCRADVFALGVLLYETLVSQHLFESGKGFERRCRFSRDDDDRIPPPHEVVRDVPQAFSDIVTRALETDPEKRYESCRALARDLKQVMDDCGLDRTQAECARFVTNYVVE